MKSVYAPNASIARIVELSALHEPDEIARMVGLDEHDVCTLLDSVKPARRGWCAVCLRTGRWWPARSWRSAYLRVCIKGLVEWDIYPFDQRAQ